MEVGLVTVGVDVLMAVGLLALAAQECSVLQGVECVAGGVQKVQIMGDNDMGLVEPLEDLYQSFPGGGVKIVAWFVKE